MDINDYLIDQAGKDWQTLLQDWMPPLPSTFTLWLVNRFGDLFVVTDDDVVHMLDVGAGAFKRVADNRDHFAQLLDQDGNAHNWLMIPFVDRCQAANMTLGPNQCYGFKIAPLLGGPYELANIEPTDLAVHYSMLADIHKQARNLPIGTPIKAVGVEGK
jgi:hypothetical protein